MKSIIYQLQTDEFPRIRFGVGQAEHDMVNHVLGRFNDTDGNKVSDAIRQLPDVIETIIRKSVSDAMNKFNGK